MPDALPLTGLYGKVPAHGDFVRRILPTSFVGPWDTWLQDGMATARGRLGDRWAAVWDAAPPWRFALPAGACGPDAVAGVLLASEDMVGRRFPITLAALLPPGAALPAPAWFAALEAAALAGRAGRLDADGLVAAIPRADAAPEDIAPTGWPLPMPADAPAGEDMPDPWAGAQPVPAADAGPSAAAEEVLDLWTGASPMAAAEDAPTSDGAASSSADDVLGLLGGGAAAGGSDAGPASTDGDVLGLLTGTEAAPVPAVAPEAADTGTLAFLLGEGRGDGPAALLPGGAAEAPDPGPADPLAALIASGDAPLTAAPVETLPAPILPEAGGLPAEAPAPMDLPPSPTEAPDPPPGGGWWTGGGGRLPPTIRPLAALLPAEDFASLLEADA